MSKTIGIVAPSINDKKFNIDFTLRLTQKKRELTLRTLFELCKSKFNIDCLKDNISYDEEMCPSAGLYLSGLLRSEGYQTYLSVSTSDEDMRHMKDIGTKIICLSTTMLLDKNSLVKVVKRIRFWMPDAFIITGGALVWRAYHYQKMFASDPKVASIAIDKGIYEKDNSAIFPTTKQEMDVDAFVISFHGIEMLRRILKELDRSFNADLSSIPNLSLPNSKGQFFFTQRSEEQIDYNNDFTRWDLLDNLPAILPVRTSVGCPYDCGFCDFPALCGKKIHLRSIDSLKTEFKMIRDVSLSRKGISMIHFTDDNVFINSKRATEICQAMIDSKTGLYWSSFMRASSINENNIDLISDSRLIMALVGVESGDPGLLKEMRKQTDLNKLKRGIELLDGVGITTIMTLLVGYPGETTDTINNTADFLNNLDTSYAMYDIFPLRVAPLSGISSPEMRSKWSLEGTESKWSHDTMSSSEVIDFGYKLFKLVDKIPYDYSEENNIYNRKFSRENRKKLFQLRQNLTIAFIEEKPWKDIAGILSDISVTMGHDGYAPDENFRHEIQKPDLSSVGC